MICRQHLHGRGHLHLEIVPGSIYSIQYLLYLLLLLLILFLVYRLLQQGLILVLLQRTNSFELVDLLQQGLLCGRLLCLKLHDLLTELLDLFRPGLSLLWQGLSVPSIAVEFTSVGDTADAIMSSTLASPSGVPWFVARTSTWYFAELSELLVLELWELTLPLIFTFTMPRFMESV